MTWLIPRFDVTRVVRFSVVLIRAILFTIIFNFRGLHHKTLLYQARHWSIASSLLHVCLPLPVLSLSFASLYLVFKFFTLAWHYFQSWLIRCSLSCFEMRSNTTWLRTAPSSSYCILLSPQIARIALTSLSVQVVPRFVNASAICGKWFTLYTRLNRLHPKVVYVNQLRNRIYTDTSHSQSWQRAGSLVCWQFVHSRQCRFHISLT